MKRPWALIVAIPAVVIVVGMAMQVSEPEKRLAPVHPSPSPSPVEASEEDRGFADFDVPMPSNAPVAASDIPTLVEGLFDPDDEESYERLQFSRGAAVPALVDALDDPRTFSTKFEDAEERSWNDPKSAFARICELLEPRLPVAAAKPLAKFVAHEDPEFRKKAAYLLGKIGTEECADAVRKALADEDEYVRSFAMMGVQHGLDDGRPMVLRGEVFPAVAELLDREGDHSAELLLTIDAERAVPIMLSPRFFRSENRYVFEILRALNEAGHKVPLDKLLPLLEAEKALIHEEYPHDYAYAAALKAYALNPDAAAERSIRAQLGSSNEQVRVAASEALMILGGVTDPWQFVIDIAEERGLEALSVPQRQYYAVFMYDSEVNNGGHSQYFFNPSGETWEDALAGLTAIGANERAKVLREAVEVTGRYRPAANAESAFDQLERSDGRTATLSELDDRYYACDEVVESLLAQYALSHKNEFGAAR